MQRRKECQVDFVFAMTLFLHGAESEDTEGIAACLPFNQQGQQEHAVFMCQLHEEVWLP